MAQKIGYISVYSEGDTKFKFREATFTRTINSRGDKVRSKMLMFPVEYAEIKDNARIMKENPRLILTREPFLLDDELRKKCIEWVAWANQAEPWEYDPFADKPDCEQENHNA